MSKITQPLDANHLSQSNKSFAEWKRLIHRKLVEKLDLSKVSDLAGDTLRRELRLVVERLCDTENPLLNRMERERLIDEILDEALAQFPERLRSVLSPAGRGIVGLVDDLLELCRDQGMLFDWCANRCRVRTLGPRSQEVTDVPLKKSVFRAILARMAALCNERKPNSVSPYGGQGELAINAETATVLRVAFTNTLDEQRLELTPERWTN